MTEQERNLKAVHHVVHDYANLVSSGTMVVDGGHRGKGFIPPINKHVGDAFLVNCRKIYDFFTHKLSTEQSIGSSKKNKKDDILAAHFLKRKLTFDLSNWSLWHEAMNKQLMHVTFARVKQPKKWEGHDENKLSLDEFMEAWKEFRRNLEEPYKSRFDSEIAKRLIAPEFQGLDLS